MERIQAFRTFARVAEMKSFTKAAESLGLPKASISSQIQQLENELGTRLLHRTTRQVQLTHDGISFYERTRDLLSDLDELKSMFQSGSSDITGRIRVDMSSRMARFRIIPISASDGDRSARAEHSIRDPKGPWDRAPVSGSPDS